MTLTAITLTEEQLPLRCFPLRRTSVKPHGFERSPNHRPAITGKHRIDARPLPSVAYTVPDGIEPANCEIDCHHAPRLALEPAIEPSPVMATVQAYHAYLAVKRAMSDDPRALAITAKQEALVLSTEGRLAQEQSNAPTFIPLTDAAASIDRVTYEPVKVGDAIVPVLVPVPLGHARVDHWHNERRSIPVHSPEPVSVEPVSVEPSETERQVFAWLAGPWFGVERTVTKRKRNRLDALMAKFWETSDGKQGLQPVMPDNAVIRSGERDLAAMAA